MIDINNKSAAENEIRMFTCLDERYAYGSYLLLGLCACFRDLGVLAVLCNSVLFITPPPSTAVTTRTYIETDEKRLALARCL